eukprot:gnl/MRDRNA2_/MRDRNA2_145100_c0_seq1.p1 gnl/MRDRNA2_/MRDRNA2_145100_c0~~gnl/MRDRNA2_/MRDRNA2_145100_c0_seq1.p1  ORF type:complete len:349 (+),score=62.75 gnl/MRDRNA2_/MRDRNA2_145100_c0_seq1:131-1177(+)
MSLHGQVGGVVVHPLGRSGSRQNTSMQKPLYRLQSCGAKEARRSQEKDREIAAAPIIQNAHGSQQKRAGQVAATACPEELPGVPARKATQSVTGHGFLITELQRLQPDFDAIEQALIFASKFEISQLAGVLRCTEEMKSGMNLLHKASQAGSLMTVTTILDLKACVNVESSLGRSALHYACDNGHTDVVKALICHQCNVNQKTPFGMTPLHIACYSNAVASVLVLLSQRKQFVEIDHEDERRRTPLMLARNELVRWMIRDYKDSLGGRYSELFLLCRDGRKPALTKREEHEFGRQLAALAWSIIHEPQSKLLPLQVNPKGLSKSLPIPIQLNCICPFLGISSTSSERT